MLDTSYISPAPAQSHKLYMYAGRNVEAFYL